MQNKITSGSKVIVLSNNRKSVVRSVLGFPDGKSFAEVKNVDDKFYTFYDVKELALDMDIDINKPIL